MIQIHHKGSLKNVEASYDWCIDDDRIEILIVRDAETKEEIKVSDKQKDCIETQIRNNYREG